MKLSKNVHEIVRKVVILDIENDFGGHFFGGGGFKIQEALEGSRIPRVIKFHGRLGSTTHFSPCGHPLSVPL